MEIDRALDHIAHIHEHLARTQVYRGIRSATLIFSGLTAFAAGILQPRIIGSEIVFQLFLVYWLGVAVINLALGAATVAWNFLFRATESERRITGRVAGQFLPAIAAAAILTSWLGAQPALFTPVLPGLWALFYGLAIFSARPFLPRAIGWVAMFFILAGGLLLKGARDGWSLDPWAMSVTFGLGQFGAAAVLFWNLERKRNG